MEKTIATLNDLIAKEKRANKSDAEEIARYEKRIAVSDLRIEALEETIERLDRWERENED